MKKKLSLADDRDSSGPRRDKKSRRNAIVLALLLGALAGTSMLLLALAPAPLTADPAQTLFATSSTDSIEQIFDTRKAIPQGRWQYIYIHHSQGGGADAMSLDQKSGKMGDHFLVDNGEGIGDGAIQVGRRWNDQDAASPKGAEVADDCISICIVGDLDAQAPTDTQMGRLQQLVLALQSRCGIPAKNVWLVDRPGSAGSCGREFPKSVFVSHLLP